MSFLRIITNDVIFFGIYPTVCNYDVKVVESI